MGFFEVLNGALASAMQSDMGHDNFRRMFESASDSKMIEWWENHDHYQNIDQEIIDMAENEMRRRGLL